MMDVLGGDKNEVGGPAADKGPTINEEPLTEGPIVGKKPGMEPRPAAAAADIPFSTAPT